MLVQSTVAALERIFQNISGTEFAQKMASDEEQDITPTRQLSHSSTLRELSSEEAKLHAEHVDKASSKLALSEKEAIAYARR